MTTLRECVKPILEKAEKEILEEMFVISIYGKKYLLIEDESDRENFKREAIEEKVKEFSSNGRKLTQSAMVDEIIKNMESAIMEGVGFFDIVFRDMDNYARQLQECLKLVAQAYKKEAEKEKDEDWKKTIEEVEKKYRELPDYSCATAKKLEDDLVTLMFDAYIRKLPPEKREELYKEVEKVLKENADKLGIDVSGMKIVVILSYGGLIALRTILGFQFHILLAIIVNAIWNLTGRLLVGKGLPLAVNAMIQRIAAVVLGPIGWVIIVITTMPLVTKLLNPREIDKYLPLVFYIYILRYKDLFEELGPLPE